MGERQSEDPDYLTPPKSAVAFESLCYSRSREIALGLTQLRSTCHPALVYFWNPLFFSFFPPSLQFAVATSLFLNKSVGAAA